MIQTTTDTPSTQTTPMPTTTDHAFPPTACYVDLEFDEVARDIDGTPILLPPSPDTVEAVVIPRTLYEALAALGHVPALPVEAF